MIPWILEPRDTVMLGDGRPIQAGALRMHSLLSPWPSTLAGLVRTRLATDENGTFTVSADASRQITVLGPWLAELAATGEPIRPLFPAPADVVWFESPGGGVVRIRLQPAPSPEGADSDLAHRDRQLDLVAPASEPPAGKPVRGPLFWTEEELVGWLVAPPDRDECGTLPGRAGPVREQRVHVSIASGTRTAEDGKLFSTEGLRFAVREPGSGELRRLALAFGCEAATLSRGTVLLGGERRPVFLREGAAVLWPQPPAWPAGAKRLRVVLVTPALFREGAVPREIAGAKVVAACVGRPEIVSGFSTEKERFGPKPTRRMAPAGSVYWVEPPPGVPAAQWAGERWMTCVSDEEQDRRDGFGLCLVGVG
ncbi:MAG: type III-B CRISPR module-associated Cmr3 family protein [Myxococcota bacterium]|jgi:CRISPR-associated protein Cmr3|nr:type III-B CRISPR module-associated Cmr3 family protein [Myxococcota bacterium]